MRHCTLLLALFAAFAVVPFAGTANAALLAYEGFEFEALGAFDGTADQTWTLGAAAETIENKDLSYSGGGVTINYGIRVLKLSGSAAYLGKAASFDFSAQTGPVYFSFLGQIANNAFFQPWVGYSAAGGTQPHFGSGMVYMDGRSVDKVVGSLVPVVIPPIVDTADLGNAKPAPIFVVAKLFKSGAGNYDRLQLEINPTTITEPGTWDGDITNDLSVSSLDRFGIRYGNNAAGWIDEIRIGTTYAEVVPLSTLYSTTDGDWDAAGTWDAPPLCSHGEYRHDRASWPRSGGQCRRQRSRQVAVDYRYRGEREHGGGLLRRDPDDQRRRHR